MFFCGNFTPGIDLMRNLCDYRLDKSVGGTFSSRPDPLPVRLLAVARMLVAVGSLLWPALAVEEPWGAMNKLLMTEAV